MLLHCTATHADMAACYRYARELRQKWNDVSLLRYRSESRNLKFRLNISGITERALTCTDNIIERKIPITVQK